MRVVVVDDEPLARSRLRVLLEEIGGAEVVAEAASGIDALAAVTATAADLLLLDIRMPGMDGIEVARHLARLPQPPAVIFTTAYDAHALAAFEVHALDYLVKPIRRERLADALARARAMTREEADGLAEGPDTSRSHVSASQRGELRLVPVSEIRCFLADQKYVAAVFPGGELLLEDSLRQLETELGPRFLRVHRNALVSLPHVEALERDRDGGYRVRLQGVSLTLTVSRRLIGTVKARLRGVRSAA